MAEKKAERVTSILRTLGVALILVGATAVRDNPLSFFFIGLALLFVRTFDMKSVQPRRLLIAEIVLTASLCISAISQLVVSRGFKAPQVFLIVLVIGALLVIVEAVREYAEL